MTTMNTLNESSPSEPIPVQGAFELYEDVPGHQIHEHLTTLTRFGRLPQVGDALPVIEGVEIGDKPIILHTVNAFGTETCDGCVSTLEQFHVEHPEIPVYSIDHAGSTGADETGNTTPEITHNYLRIDQETAIDLGVALEPGENAADFWATALRRSLIVADKHGIIMHIQQHDDQEQVPDFLQAYEAVLAASE